MSLIDSVKHAAHDALNQVVGFDENGHSAEKKPTPPRGASPHPAFNLGSMSAASAPSPSMSFPTSDQTLFKAPATPPMDEGVYQSVLKKTNFATTTVGQAILESYDSAEGFIPDSTQRLKFAVSNVQKTKGITAEQILQTFDQLQAALDADAKDFGTVAASFEKDEITARQNKITQLNQEIEAKQQQVQQLQTEVADKQASHANATTQHNMVQQRRAQELTTQKAQITASLN